MRLYSGILRLLIISLVFFSVYAFAAPPAKIKPKARTGRDIAVLEGAWQTLKDAGDKGVTGGWQNDVPERSGANVRAFAGRRHDREYSKNRRLVLEAF